MLAKFHLANQKAKWSYYHIGYTLLILSDLHKCVEARGSIGVNICTNRQKYADADTNKQRQTDTVTN